MLFSLLPRYMLLRSTKKGSAPAHCVLHPDMWQKLRTDPTFMFDDEDSEAEFAINLHSPDPSNPVQDS